MNWIKRLFGRKTETKQCAIHTVRSKAFTQGYICACATMLQDCGNGTAVEYCLRGIFISIEDLRKHDVDEYDIEVLMPVIKEIERKRALAK